MGPVGGTTSPAPTASILLGLADVLVRRPCTAVLVAWVASARGRSACRRRRKPGQKKIFLRQRSPQPRRKQARAHRQVAGQPNGLLRLHRLASSFALRRASVRKLKGAYIRAARRFLKAGQLWDEQQDTHERLVASAEKRAKKAHPKGALRLAVAAQAECSLQVKLHRQHGIWTDIIKETWQAEAAMLQREKELLQLQVQMLQRRVRRARMGALR